MVFQDPYGSLHPRHTIGDILEEPLQIHRIRDRDRRMNMLLDKVGLNRAFRERYPHQLRRPAAARGNCQSADPEPQVLLLDEPTSALDVRCRPRSSTCWRSCSRRLLTYLMVTHDLGVIAHLCQKVAVMQYGKILETLTVDALVNGEAQTAYTQMLVNASQQYTREMARAVSMY